MWDYNNVKETFVDFFKKYNHTHIPSSSVVPINDPSLLFTNSGMVQFKNIFVGTTTTNTKRACNIQRCIRAGGKHNDLDDVGKDSYHHTFFEMAGNWSFNFDGNEDSNSISTDSYFKSCAIEMAWKLLIDVYKLDKRFMYVTYFQGCEELGLPPDFETKGLWEKYLPSEKILPFGMKENFWEMGFSGPCGPCTEIHYDKSNMDRDASLLVNKDDPSVIEIWNLVFMQYMRIEDGSIFPLEMKHVDTGAGVERLTAVLQNCTNYQIDIFQDIMNIIYDVFCRNCPILVSTTPPVSLPYVDLYGSDDPDYVNTAYRVIADHVRTMIFAINDGVIPASTDKGYVVRRLIRRALRYCTKIQDNPKDGILSEIVGDVFNLLCNKYKYGDVLKRKDDIVSIVLEEEIKFGKVMKKGLRLFNNLLKKNKLDMKNLFNMYTTFGFPVDIIKQLCQESNIKFIDDDFDTLMNEHIEKSKRVFGKN